MTTPLLLAAHIALAARKPSETLRHAKCYLLRRYTLGGGLHVLNLGHELFEGPAHCVEVFGEVCVRF